MACSARQLVASTDRSHKKRNTAANLVARCRAKRSASSTRWRCVNEPTELGHESAADRCQTVLAQLAVVAAVTHGKARLQDPLHLPGPETVGMIFLADLWGSWSPVERAHDEMKRADDTGSGESASLSAESGQLQSGESRPRVEPLLYRPAEAAEFLRVSPSKLHELLNSGEIPWMRLGGVRRVPVEAIRQLAGESHPRVPQMEPLFYRPVEAADGSGNMKRDPVAT